MTLDEILNEWAIDAKIDRSELVNESLKIPVIHNKYYRIYISEKKIFKKLEAEYKTLLKIKHEYYSGKLSPEELKEKNWEPFKFILKNNIDLYIDADKDIIETSIKLALSKERVDMLLAIMQSITNRTYQIKNAIDMLKLESGVG